VFGFLIFKSAEVHAAAGPFVSGSSANISPSQSTGRLALLPVSQRLGTSNLPSAVLRLIHQSRIQKLSRATSWSSHSKTSSIAMS
jgi:hypothetical protein